MCQRIRVKNIYDDCGHWVWTTGGDVLCGKAATKGVYCRPFKYKTQPLNSIGKCMDCLEKEADECCGDAKGDKAIEDKKEADKKKVARKMWDRKYLAKKNKGKKPEQPEQPEQPEHPEVL